MTPRLQWMIRQEELTGADLESERLQSTDEGRDLTPVAAELDRLLAVKNDQRDETWFDDAGRLMDRIQTLPAPHREPSDLTAIQAVRPKRPRLRRWRGTEKEFRERLHGGLLGRICGCMLGKPFECRMRDVIREMAEKDGQWPLKKYLRPHPHGAIEDDDINYTVTGFAVLKQHGSAFTPFDVASFWLQHMPIGHTFTAERATYRNLTQCITPPASATHRNPYREWIGAQIRADYFGYANPGNPARAAEWAWRDASVSHIKNGIYGEMWVAAMLAAAYIEDDWTTIIRAGLAEIPAESRLTADIEKILAAHAAGRSYEDVIQLIHTQWDERCKHHWCHANSNAQIVAVGLLWGEDDFEATITRAVMAAFDTDCNGATCGSLWGVKHGVRALPAKWTRPMRDTVHTGVAGYYKTKISVLAREMADVARTVSKKGKP